MAEYLSEISVVPPEGTYLIWLDCRRLGLDQAGLKRLMEHKARVYLDDGSIFGAEGAGFQRMNIACPRSILRAYPNNWERAWGGRSPPPNPPPTCVIRIGP